MKVLVLSGGGSHGAFQAGVLVKLAEQGEVFDAIVGTSVGAINGAGFSGLGGAKLADMWLGISGRRAIMRYNFPWPWAYKGVFHFKPLRRKLTSWLANAKYTTPMYVSTLSLETLKLNFQTLKGEIQHDVEHILASSSVATIQSPHNGLCVDGGHKEIAPIRFAVEALGAKEITVVLCDPPQNYREDGWKPKKFFPIISIGLRALTSMIDEILRTDIINCPEGVRLRIFQPQKDLGVDALDYSPDKIKRMLFLGYEEALRGSDKN